MTKLTATATRRLGIDVFSTGDIARMCGVAPRTVAIWIDKGKLPAYRIPLSQDRRVMKADLIAFMRSHGLPLPDGLGGGPDVLLATPDAALSSGLLAHVPPARVTVAPSAFELGRLAARPWAAVLLDAMLGKVAVLTALTHMADNVGSFFVLVGEDGDGAADFAAIGDGATIILRPADAATVAGLLLPGGR